MAETDHRIWKITDVALGFSMSVLISLVQKGGLFEKFFVECWKTTDVAPGSPGVFFDMILKIVYSNGGGNSPKHIFDY